MGKKDPPVDSSQTPVHAKQHVAASANKSKIIDLTFASQKAAQTLRQKSEQADAASKTEFHNKMRCMQFEQMIQKERIDCSQLTTAPPKRSGIQTQTSIQKGEYVHVKEDLSKGKKVLEGMDGSTMLKRREHRNSLRLDTSLVVHVPEKATYQSQDSPC